MDCWRSALMALVAAAGCCAAPARADHLAADTLLEGHRVGETDFAAYAPPADAEPPSAAFEGSLRLSGTVHTRTIRKNRDFLTRKQLQAAQSFPDADFDYEFVQQGDALLPVRRGYLVTDHPYWDLVLEPGRVWDEPGDGDYTRAAVPFALVQKHMNCTHYGVLTFVFRDDGTSSQAAVQVASETCKYLKLDMWGLLDAEYDPHTVAGRDSVMAAHRANVDARLPTRPLSELAARHPDIDVSQLALGKPSGRTLYGLVFEGTNYVAGCATRHGDYPYCDVLPFPSYSLAKSVAAGIGYMALARQHPDLAEASVAGNAPVAGCRSQDWRDVTLRNLLDMTSGHYDSAAYEADENAPNSAHFFRAHTLADKADFACNAYPRKSDPGSTWVYHTADTFLLGATMQHYWRDVRDDDTADVFDDIVDAGVFAPLTLSATARHTRRTADAAAQPFFGYGLQFHRDDIVRLARFLQDGGKLDAKPTLDPALMDAAMQRDANARGSKVTGYPNLRYQAGFWARNVAPVIGCQRPLWVPFMSGVGGISVVMYPDGSIYYSVNDSDTPAVYDWSPSARVVNALHGLCP